MAQPAWKKAKKENSTNPTDTDVAMGASDRPGGDIASTSSSAETGSDSSAPSSDTSKADSSEEADLERLEDAYEDFYTLAAELDLTKVKEEASSRKKGEKNGCDLPGKMDSMLLPFPNRGALLAF